MKKQMNASQKTKLSEYLQKEPGNPLDHYRSLGPPIDAQLFREIVWGEAWATKQDVLSKISSLPGFDHDAEIGKNAYELYLQYAQMMQGIFYLAGGNVQVNETAENPKQGTAIMQSLFGWDTSIGTLIGVHVSLYLDTMLFLGTEKHQKLVEDASAFKDLGCFGMTEIGHGTNVMGLETTATYDHATREFILSSPTHTAAKLWIGAAGRTANRCTVFAQLIIDGESHGLHVFAITLRDFESHEVLPGIIIGNLGEKVGVRAVDNGFIFFDNVRVPYDSLLDRYSQISEDGKFKTNIENDMKRFAAMMAGLTRGRMGVVWQADGNLRNLITIAVRYAAVRRQFGKPGNETIILDYPLHRYRLMPILANSLMTSFLAEYVQDQFIRLKNTIETDPESEEIAQLHIKMSIFKPLVTWWAQRAAQECREACGGHGYSAYARLGTIRDNNDVIVTWEGDNNVILQQVSRFLLRKIQKIMGGEVNDSPMLQFLNLNMSEIQEEKIEFASAEELNADTLRKMLVHNVNFLLFKSLTHLQENVSKAPDQLTGWNESQVHHLNESAKAFGYLITSDIFNEFIQKAKHHEPTYDVFCKLHELYILNKIESQLYNYRENDYLSWQQSEMIMERIRQVTFELGDSSVQIIDAIAYPDAVVGSSIAKSDGQLYYNFISAIEKYEGWYAEPTWLPLLKKIRAARPKL